MKSWVSYLLNVTRIRHRSHLKPAFTIVELLVVIVVIGVLAAITVVSYTGITNKASVASLQSDLANASMQLKMFQIENGKYPDTISTNCVTNPDTTTNKCIRFSSSDTYNIYQKNNSTNPQSFCLNAINKHSLKINQDSAPLQGACVDFSSWTMDGGGVIYDISTDHISLIGSGYVSSPLIKVSNSSSVTLSTESYATTASPSLSPLGGVYFNSFYYAADGVTPVYNSIGYISNGNAQTIPLSDWTKRSWQIPTGSNVVYIRFRIWSSPTSYTSNNKFRNPTVTFS